MRHYAEHSRFFSSSAKLALMFFFFWYMSSSVAFGADIEARSAVPSSGATFYEGDTLDFYGESVNRGGTVVAEGGWAGVEIDWGSDGNVTADTYYDAFGGVTTGAYIVGEVKPLYKQLVAPLGGHPVGTHRYRFNADSTNVLVEANELNNRSAWRSFTINPTPFAPVITLTATPTPIASGQSTTLNWSVVNADSCNFDPNGWNNANALVGSEVVTPGNTTTYTIDCNGPGGTASNEFTVDVTSVPPVVTFTASQNTITTGQSTTLSWTVSGASSCSASGAWSGSKNRNGGNDPVSPVTTSTYTLTCDGPGGTTVTSQTITVNPVLPVITFTATPSTIITGNSSQLAWSVTGATSCYSNSFGSSPYSKNPVSGTSNVSPIVNTTYTLNCGNVSGTTTAIVSIIVTGPPDLEAAVTFSGGNRITMATGTVLQVGQTTTLKARTRNIGGATTSAGFTNNFQYRWGWMNSQSLGYITRPALGPNQSHDPYDESEPLTFDRAGYIEMQYCADRAETLPTSQIAESNESNNCGWRSYTVAGLPGSPTLNLSITNFYSASTSFLHVRPRVGASSTVTWSTTDATSCLGETNSTSIHDAGWNGPKPTSGSFEISPFATTSFALTCTGPTGTIVKAIRVNTQVLPPQILNFSAVTNPIPKGGMVDLTWTATSSYTCTASGGWSGAKDRKSGTESVGPVSSQTTYTLTCTTPTGGGAIGGTVSRTITVDVYEPPPVITMNASQNPITPLDTTNLSWNAAGASSCTASGGNAGWPGSKSINDSVAIDPDVTTTYTLTCTGSGGTTTSSYTVTVVEAAPLITFSSSKTTIVEGSPVQISWQVLGATACTPSTDPNDPSGGWNSVLSASLIDQAGGSVSISPSITRKYMLDCTGPWGQTPRDLTVYVIEKAEITQFEVCTVGNPSTCVNPSNTSEEAPWTINPGTPIEIRWDTDPDTATFCSTAGGNGFSTNGLRVGQDDARISAYPGSTDEYAIGCGTAGLLSNSAKIYVEVNKVQPDIEISPRVLPPGGGDVTVSWDTNNGDQSVCSISGGGLSGNLPDTGGDTGSQIIEDITGRTTFSITCGTETDTVTVELNPTLYET